MILTSTRAGQTRCWLQSELLTWLLRQRGVILFWFRNRIAVHRGLDFRGWGWLKPTFWKVFQPNLLLGCLLFWFWYWFTVHHRSSQGSASIHCEIVQRCGGKVGHLEVRIWGRSTWEGMQARRLFVFWRCGWRLRGTFPAHCDRWWWASKATASTPCRSLLASSWRNERPWHKARL